MDLPSSEWWVQADWSRLKHLNFLFYWRVNEASETLTGVTQLKSGMFVCLYIGLDVLMSFVL